MDIPVLLVGDGPNLNLIRAEVAAAGLDELVQFTGRLSSEAKTRAMSACDILVLPSLIEGLPYMITEALSYAKPVIASNVGGIPEQVLDGETGLLVPPRDALALANAIRSLVKDPNLVRRMGAGALQHYRQHFTLERMLDDHDALYQALYHSQRNKI
ncbi:MAG: glycosyltransferase family 4 protein [Chloroflexales bacterium]